jgi:arsenate reductase
MLKVLFLCTGNSARSILAEYLMRKMAPARFETHSAGARPTGRVNPLAVRTLHELYDVDASGAESKSWDRFRDMHFDFVITVCDNARESCPIFPGQTTVLHWSLEDPAAVEGTEEEKYGAFKETAREIQRRLELFLATQAGASAPSPERSAAASPPAGPPAAP